MEKNKQTQKRKKKTHTMFEISFIPQYQNRRTLLRVAATNRLHYAVRLLKRLSPVDAIHHNVEGVRRRILNRVHHF
jgi:hypothetical protein